MSTCWRPTPYRLAARVDVARRGDVTYDQVGATRGRQLPAGHLERSAVVGAGREAFDRVSGALLRWDLHRAAGLVVAASDGTVAVGSTAVIAAVLGPVGLLAPCRVVYVVREAGRCGFAYGTLPGHPLSGEERFTVELGSGGRVVLRIVSFSRPVGVARFGAPVVRAVQQAVDRRYEAAGRRLAA